MRDVRNEIGFQVNKFHFFSNRSEDQPRSRNQDDIEQQDVLECPGVQRKLAVVQIGRDALTRMEVTLELTENLYTKGSGKVKKTDYLRNKTVVEWLRTAVTSLGANEQLARSALTNSMGMDWEAPVEPAPQEP